MKKKELKRRLAVTQEWLEKFQDSTAEATVQAMLAQKERDDLHSELARCELVIMDLRAKVEQRWWCPWCNVERFTSSSDLRLHEQECGSNRNKWQPERRPVGWQQILVELGLDDIKGLVSVDTMIHEIKVLKHNARPVCIFCGASTNDIASMRTHVVVEHAINAAKFQA